MKTLKYRILLLIFTVFFFSCNKEPILPSLERGSLISVNEGGSLSKAQVAASVSDFSAESMVKYDVSYHSVTYRTVYNQKPINSRGLLILPQQADSVCLLAYFHGTQIPLKMAGVDRQIPSLYDGGTEDFYEVRHIALVLASAGYAVFLPDYIGYASTSDKEHPYVYYPELFESNIDGLLAARNAMDEKGFPHDQRLFITGWSQGAGASLSAHRYIQEKYSSDFTVVASSGLAGPYNFTAFLNDIFQRKNEEIPLINIYSWGVYVVNKFSGIKRPADQLWSYPVFDQTSAFIPPSKAPSAIFNNFFLERIVNQSDVEMVAVIKKNSFHEGWLPVGKVFLHHGDADEIVPYFNSVDALAGLSSAGGDVTLYSYPGGSHSSEVENYVTKTLNDFNALK